MADVRLSLSKRDREAGARKVRPERVRDLLEGKASWADALGYSDSDLARLREEARSYAVSGHFARARSQLDFLATLGDRHPLLIILRAACSAGEERWDDAIRELEEGIAQCRAAELTEIADHAAEDLAQLRKRTARP